MHQPVCEDQQHGDDNRVERGGSTRRRKRQPLSHKEGALPTSCAGAPPALLLKGNATGVVTARERAAKSLTAGTTATELAAATRAYAGPGGPVEAPKSDAKDLPEAEAAVALKVAAGGFRAGPVATTPGGKLEAASPVREGISWGVASAKKEARAETMVPAESRKGGTATNVTTIGRSAGMGGKSATVAKLVTLSTTTHEGRTSHRRPWDVSFLKSLPRECLYAILAFLDLGEVPLLRLVSHELRAAVDAPAALLDCCSLTLTSAVAADASSPSHAVVRFHSALRSLRPQQELQNQSSLQQRQQQEVRPRQSLQSKCFHSKQQHQHIGALQPRHFFHQQQQQVCCQQPCDEHQLQQRQSCNEQQQQQQCSTGIQVQHEEGDAGRRQEQQKYCRLWDRHTQQHHLHWWTGYNQEKQGRPKKHRENLQQNCSEKPFNCSEQQELPVSQEHQTYSFVQQVNGEQQRQQQGMRHAKEEPNYQACRLQQQQEVSRRLRVYGSSFWKSLLLRRPHLRRLVICREALPSLCNFVSSNSRSRHNSISHSTYVCPGGPTNNYETILSGSSTDNRFNHRGKNNSEDGGSSSSSSSTGGYQYPERLLLLLQLIHHNASVLQHLKITSPDLQCRQPVNCSVSTSQSQSVHCSRCTGKEKSAGAFRGIHPDDDAFNGARDVPVATEVPFRSLHHPSHKTEQQYSQPQQHPQQHVKSQLPHQHTQSEQGRRSGQRMRQIQKQTDVGPQASLADARQRQQQQHAQSHSCTSANCCWSNAQELSKRTKETGAEVVADQKQRGLLPSRWCLQRGRTAVSTSPAAAAASATRAAEADVKLAGFRDSAAELAATGRGEQAETTHTAVGDLSGSCRFSGTTVETAQNIAASTASLTASNPAALGALLGATSPPTGPSKVASTLVAAKQERCNSCVCNASATSLQKQHGTRHTGHCQSLPESVCFSGHACWSEPSKQPAGMHHCTIRLPTTSSFPPLSVSQDSYAEETKHWEAHRSQLQHQQEQLLSQQHKHPAHFFKQQESQAASPCKSQVSLGQQPQLSKQQQPQEQHARLPLHETEPPQHLSQEQPSARPRRSQPASSQQQELLKQQHQQQQQRQQQQQQQQSQQNQQQQQKQQQHCASQRHKQREQIHSQSFLKPLHGCQLNSPHLQLLQSHDPQKHSVAPFLQQQRHLHRDYLPLPSSKQPLQQLQPGRHDLPGALPHNTNSTDALLHVRFLAMTPDTLFCQPSSYSSGVDSAAAAFASLLATPTHATGGSSHNSLDTANASDSIGSAAAQIPPVPSTASDSHGRAARSPVALRCVQASAEAGEGAPDGLVSVLPAFICRVNTFAAEPAARSNDAHGATAPSALAEAGVALPASVAVVTGDSIHFEQLRTVQLLGCHSFFWLHLLFSRCSLPRCVEFSLVSKCLAVHTPRAVPPLLYTCSTAAVAAPNVTTTTTTTPSPAFYTTCTTNNPTVAKYFPSAAGTVSSASAAALSFPLTPVTASSYHAPMKRAYSANDPAFSDAVFDAVVAAESVRDGALPSGTAAALAGNAAGAAATPKRSCGAQNTTSAAVVSKLMTSTADSHFAAGVTMFPAAYVTSCSATCQKKHAGAFHQGSADQYEARDKTPFSASTSSQKSASNNIVLADIAANVSTSVHRHAALADPAAYKIVPDFVCVSAPAKVSAAESASACSVNCTTSHNHASASAGDEGATTAVYWNCSNTNSSTSRALLFSTAAPRHPPVPHPAFVATQEQTCSFADTEAMTAAAGAVAPSGLASAATVPGVGGAVATPTVAAAAAAAQCHIADVLRGPASREGEITAVVASDFVVRASDNPFADGASNEAHACFSLSSAFSSGTAGTNPAQREESVAAADVYSSAGVGNKLHSLSTRFDDDLVKLLESAPRLRVLRLETSLPVGRAVWKALLAGCSSNSSKPATEMSSCIERDGRTGGPAIDSSGDGPKSITTIISDNCIKRSISSSSRGIKSRNLESRCTSSSFIDRGSLSGRNVSCRSINSKSITRSQISPGADTGRSNSILNNTGGCLCPFLEDLTITDRSVPPLVEVLRTLQNSPPAGGIPAATAAAAARLACLENERHRRPLTWGHRVGVAAATTLPACEQNSLPLQMEAHAGSHEYITLNSQKPSAFASAATPLATLSAIEATAALSMQATAGSPAAEEERSEVMVGKATGTALLSPISAPTHVYVAASTRTIAAEAFSRIATRETAIQAKTKAPTDVNGARNDSLKAETVINALILPRTAARKTAPAGTAFEQLHILSCNSSEVRKPLSSLDKRELHALNSQYIAAKTLSTAVSLPLTSSLQPAASTLTDYLKIDLIRSAVNCTAAPADNHVANVYPTLFVLPGVSAVKYSLANSSSFFPTPTFGIKAQGEHALTTLPEAAAVVPEASKTAGVFSAALHAEAGTSSMADLAFPAAVTSTNATPAIKPPDLDPAAFVADFSATMPSGVYPVACSAAAGAMASPARVLPESSGAAAVVAAAAMPPARVLPDTSDAAAASATRVTFPTAPVYDRMTVFPYGECVSGSLSCSGTPNTQARSQLLLWGRRGLTLSLRRSRIGGLEKWGQRLPAVILESLQQLVLSCAPSCEICLDALAATSSSSATSNSSRRYIEDSGSNAVGRTDCVNSNNSDRRVRDSGSCTTRCGESRRGNSWKKTSETNRSAATVTTSDSNIHHHSHKHPHDNSPNNLHTRQRVNAHCSSGIEASSCGNTIPSSWECSPLKEERSCERMHLHKTDSNSSNTFCLSNRCSSRKSSAYRRVNRSSRGYKSSFALSRRTSSSLSHHAAYKVYVTKCTAPFCSDGSSTASSCKSNISSCESRVYTYLARQQRANKAKRRWRQASSKGSVRDDNRGRTVGGLCRRHKKRRRKDEGHGNSSAGSAGSTSRRVGRSTDQSSRSREGAGTRSMEGREVLNTRETSTSRKGRKQQNGDHRQTILGISHRLQRFLCSSSTTSGARDDTVLVETASLQTQAAGSLPGGRAAALRMLIPRGGAAAVTSSPAAETAVFQRESPTNHMPLAANRAPAEDCDVSRADAFCSSQRVATTGNGEVALLSNKRKAEAPGEVMALRETAYPFRDKASICVICKSGNGCCSDTTAGTNAALAAVKTSCSDNSDVDVATVSAFAASVMPAPSNPSRRIGGRALLPRASVTAQDGEQTEAATTPLYEDETETAAAAALERSLLQLRSLRLVYDDPEHDICFTSHQRRTAQRQQQRNVQWQRPPQQLGVHQRLRKERQDPRFMSGQMLQQREQQALQFMSTLQRQQGERQTCCSVSVPQPQQNEQQTPRLMGSLQNRRQQVQRPGQQAQRKAVVSARLRQQVQGQYQRKEELHQHQPFQKHEGTKAEVHFHHKTCGHLQQHQVQLMRPGNVGKPADLLLEEQKQLVPSAQHQDERHTVQRTAQQISDAEAESSAEAKEHTFERFQSQKRASRLLQQHVATSRLQHYYELHEDQGDSMRQQKIQQQQQIPQQQQTPQLQQVQEHGQRSLQSQQVQQQQISQQQLPYFQKQQQRKYSEQQCRKFPLPFQQQVQQQLQKQPVNHHKQQQHLGEHVSAGDTEDVAVAAFSALDEGRSWQSEFSDSVPYGIGRDKRETLCSDVSDESSSRSSISVCSKSCSRTNISVRDRLIDNSCGRRGSHPGNRRTRDGAVASTADGGNQQSCSEAASRVCCSDSYRRDGEICSNNVKGIKSEARKKSSSRRFCGSKRGLCSVHDIPVRYRHCKSITYDSPKNSIHCSVVKESFALRKRGLIGLRKIPYYVSGQYVRNSKSKFKNTERNWIYALTRFGNGVKCESVRSNNDAVPGGTIESSSMCAAVRECSVTRRNISHENNTKNLRNTITGETTSSRFQATAYDIAGLPPSDVRGAAAAVVLFSAAAGAEVLEALPAVQHVGERDTSGVVGGIYVIDGVPGISRVAGHNSGARWRHDSLNRQQGSKGELTEKAEKDKRKDSEKLFELRAGEVGGEEVKVDETWELRRKKGSASQTKAAQCGANSGGKGKKYKLFSKEGISTKVEYRTKHRNQEALKTERAVARQQRNEGREDLEKAIRDNKASAEARKQEEEIGRTYRNNKIARKRRRSDRAVVEEKDEIGNEVQEEERGRREQGERGSIRARLRTRIRYQQLKGRRSKRSRKMEENRDVERQGKERGEGECKTKAGHLEETPGELQGTNDMAMEDEKQEKDRREQQEQQDRADLSEEEELLLLPHLQRLSIDFFNFSPSIHRNVFRCRFGTAAVARAMAAKRFLKASQASSGTTTQKQQASTAPPAKAGLLPPAKPAAVPEASPVTAPTPQAQAALALAAVSPSAHWWGECSQWQDCEKSSSERSDYDSDSSPDYTCPSFCVEGLPLHPMALPPSISSGGVARSTGTSPVTASVAEAGTAAPGVTRWVASPTFRAASAAPSTSSAVTQAAASIRRSCGTVVHPFATPHGACVLKSNTHPAATGCTPCVSASIMPSVTSTAAADGIAISSPPCKLPPRVSSLLPPISVSSSSSPAERSLSSAAAPPSVRDLLEASALPLLRSPAFASFVLVLQPHPTGFRFPVSAAASSLKGPAPARRPAADVSTPATQAEQSYSIFFPPLITDSSSGPSASESSLLVKATTASHSPFSPLAFSASSPASSSIALASPVSALASAATASTSLVGALASFASAPSSPTNASASSTSAPVSSASARICASDTPSRSSAPLAGCPASSASSFTQINDVKQPFFSVGSKRIALEATSSYSCCSSSGSHSNVRYIEQICSRACNSSHQRRNCGPTFCRCTDSRSTDKQSCGDSISTFPIGGSNLKGNQARRADRPERSRRSMPTTKRSASGSSSCSRSEIRNATKRYSHFPERRTNNCHTETNHINNRNSDIPRKSEASALPRLWGSRHSNTNNSSTTDTMTDLGRSSFLSNSQGFPATTGIGQSCCSPSSQVWRERRRQQHRADAELLSVICRDPCTRRKLRGVELRLEALFEGTRVTALMETLARLAIEEKQVYMRPQLQQHRDHGSSPGSGLRQQHIGELFQQHLLRPVELQAKQHEVVQTAKNIQRKEQRALQEGQPLAVSNDSTVIWPSITENVAAVASTPTGGCADVMKTEGTSAMMYSSKTTARMQARTAVSKSPAEAATPLAALASGTLASPAAAITSAELPIATAVSEGRRCAFSLQRTRGDNKTAAPRLRLLRLSNQTLTLKDVLVSVTQGQWHHGYVVKEEQGEEHYKNHHLQGLQSQYNVHHQGERAERQRHQEHQQYKSPKDRCSEPAKISTVQEESEETAEAPINACVLCSSVQRKSCYKSISLRDNYNCGGVWCSSFPPCCCIYNSSSISNLWEDINCRFFPSATWRCCCCCYHAACSCYNTCRCCWRLLAKTSDCRSTSCWDAGDFTLNSSGERVLQSLQSFVEAYPTIKRIEATVPSFLFDGDEVEGFHEEPEQLHVLDLLLHAVGFCRRRDRRAAVARQKQRKEPCKALSSGSICADPPVEQEKNEAASDENALCSKNAFFIREAESSKKDPRRGKAACSEEAVPSRNAPSIKKGAQSIKAAPRKECRCNEEAAFSEEAAVNKVEPSSREAPYSIKHFVSVGDTLRTKDPYSKKSASSKKGAPSNKAAPIRENTPGRTDAGCLLNNFAAGGAKTHLAQGNVEMNISEKHCHHNTCCSSFCNTCSIYQSQLRLHISEADQQRLAAGHSRRETSTATGSGLRLEAAYKTSTSHAALHPRAISCTSTDAIGLAPSVPDIKVGPTLEANRIVPARAAATVFTGCGSCGASGPTFSSEILSPPASALSFSSSPVAVVPDESAASSATTDTSDDRLDAAARRVKVAQTISPSTAMEISAYRELVVYYRLPNAKSKSRCCCCCCGTQYLQEQCNNPQEHQAYAP